MGLVPKNKELIVSNFNTFNLRGVSAVVHYICYINCTNEIYDGIS